MYCMNCGHEVESGSYFCGECDSMIFKNLIEDAKKGKEAALKILIQNTQNKLFYIAYRFVKDSGVAEDLVQETYIHGFKKLDSLQEPENFFGWITSSLIHRCKNYMTTKKNTKIIDFSSLEDSEDNLDFEDTIMEERMEFVPDKNFNYEQLKKGLDQVLNELPDNQRMALLLYYLDEFKVKEVSTIMGISQGTVKSLLNYGRKAIKEKIEELRRQNKSFYSIAPIPFLVWALKEEVKAQSLSPYLVQNVIKNVGVSRLSSSSTSIATKGMLSIGGKTLSAKVIAGLTALVIGAGSIGGYTLSQMVFKGTENNKQESKYQQTEDEDILAYQDLLNEYFEILASGTIPGEQSDSILSEFEQSIKEMVLSGKSVDDLLGVYQLSEDDRLNSCGYKFVDLNDDGTRELLIGNIELGQQGSIFQLFALDENYKPIVVQAETYNRLNNSMAREPVQSFGNYNYYLGSDYKIYFSGWTSKYEEGVHVAGQYQFEFDGTKLVCEEAYESGSKNYKIDMDTKNIEEVSPEEASTFYENKIQKDFLSIDFTPFSDIADTRNEQIQKDGFALKYLDAKISIPKLLKYKYGYPTPVIHTMNYVTMFQSDDQNNTFESFNIDVLVYCWSQELFPTSPPPIPLESKKNNVREKERKCKPRKCGVLWFRRKIYYSFIFQ